MRMIERTSDATANDGDLEIDEDLWSRFRGAVGEGVLDKVHNTSVLLFGAGKIGSLMALNLLMMGTRRITIVDYDKLETHNLFATFGATASDVGRCLLYTSPSPRDRG